MRGRKITAALAGLFLASLAGSGWAAPWQGWRGSGGWGMGGAYQRMYDAAKVETVTGEVVSVERFSGGNARNGIHLQLKTERETIPVHLGPAWYIERLDTRIQKGDRLEVKGSRVSVANKPALIAAEVRKGDELLKLRDESGVPVWAGWRRNR